MIQMECCYQWLLIRLLPGRLLRQWLALGACLSLSSCYYAHDLRNQTIGSLGLGGGAGLIIAEGGGSLASISAGVIGGGIIGSMIGQYYDNHSRFMRENPLTAPVHRYYYSVLRPDLTVDCFCSGSIIYYPPARHLPVIYNNPPTVNELDC